MDDQYIYRLQVRSGQVYESSPFQISERLQNFLLESNKSPNNGFGRAWERSRYLISICRDRQDRAKPREHGRRGGRRRFIWQGSDNLDLGIFQLVMSFSIECSQCRINKKAPTPVCNPSSEILRPVALTT